MRFTCATTSRFDSTFMRKSNCPGATAADNRITPPFSNTNTDVVSSLNSSRSTVPLPGATPVAVRRTSCATMFVFNAGVGFNSGASASPGSGACSSSRGLEELAGGEVVSRLMSSAEDNLVFPGPRLARGPGQNSSFVESSAFRTVYTLPFSQPSYTLCDSTKVLRDVSSTFTLLAVRGTWQGASAGQCCFDLA